MKRKIAKLKRKQGLFPDFLKSRFDNSPESPIFLCHNGSQRILLQNTKSALLVKRKFPEFAPYLYPYLSIYFNPEMLRSPTGIARFTHRRAFASQSHQTSSGSLWPWAMGSLTLGLVGYYAMDSRAAIHSTVILPALRATTDAETSHQLAIQFAKRGLSPVDRQPDADCLQSKVRSKISPAELISICSCLEVPFPTRSVWLRDLIRMRKL